MKVPREERGNAFLGHLTHLTLITLGFKQVGKVI